MMDCDMARPKIIETKKQIQNRHRQSITLRVLRAAFGFTQKDLALHTGVSYSTIAKFERGDLKISEETHQRLIAFFEGKGVRFSHHGNEVSFTLSAPFMTSLYLQRHLIWSG